MSRFALALALVLAVALPGMPARAADGGFRVCLDPGHGGSDPGAVRGALVEKELDLDIALGSPRRSTRTSTSSR